MPKELLKKDSCRRISDRLGYPIVCQSIHPGAIPRGIQKVAADLPTLHPTRSASNGKPSTSIADRNQRLGKQDSEPIAPRTYTPGTSRQTPDVKRLPPFPEHSNTQGLRPRISQAPEFDEQPANSPSWPQNCRVDKREGRLPPNHRDPDA